MRSDLYQGMTRFVAGHKWLFLNKLEVLATHRQSAFSFSHLFSSEIIPNRAMLEMKGRIDAQS
jgi:hypothetical protein